MKNKLRAVALSGFLFTGVLGLTNVSVVEASRENVAVVQKGDSLYKIASMHDITVVELMEVNRLTGTNIKVGQILYIYDNPKYKKSISSTSSLHTVKKKETLYSISKKYGLTIDQLKKMNGLKSEGIKTGDTLKVKVKKSLSSTSSKKK